MTLGSFGPFPNWEPKGFKKVPMRSNLEDFSKTGGNVKHVSLWDTSILHEFRVPLFAECSGFEFHRGCLVPIWITLGSLEVAVWIFFRKQLFLCVVQIAHSL